MAAEIKCNNSGLGFHLFCKCRKAQCTVARTVKAEEHVALVASDVNRNSPVEDKLLAVEKVAPG